MLPQEDGNGRGLWRTSPQPVEPMLLFSFHLGTWEQDLPLHFSRQEAERTYWEKFAGPCKRLPHCSVTFYNGRIPKSALIFHTYCEVFWGLCTKGINVLGVRLHLTPY